MGKHKHNKTKKGGLYTTPPPVQPNYGESNYGESNYGEQPNEFTRTVYAPPPEKTIGDTFKKTDDDATNALKAGVKNISDNVVNVTKPVVEPVQGFFGNLLQKAKDMIKKPASNETIGSSIGVQPGVGGKKRRGGGGFRPSQDYGIAASGAPVNGIKTVNANSYIGGKKSKRGKRKGSRKSRKSHRKK